MPKKISDTLRKNLEQAVKNGDQEQIDWLLDWAEDA